jgi:hypothetical protein
LLSLRAEQVGRLALCRNHKGGTIVRLELPSNLDPISLNSYSKAIPTAFLIDRVIKIAQLNKVAIKWQRGTGARDLALSQQG